LLQNRGLSRSRRAAAADNFTTPPPPPKNACRRADTAAADILFGAPPKSCLDFVFYVNCSSTADLSQLVVILSFCTCCVQGWQVFEISNGLWKKPVFSMEKTVPAKIVFAGRKKPPGKNPAKLVLQTCVRWKK
jgi:hypothetical protein